MIKRNYYGLKNGEYLGYNAGRDEKYFYCIFEDGSECVKIETATGRRYIFGNIAYCKKMYRLGHSFRGEGLTENFINALCA